MTDANMGVMMYMSAQNNLREFGDQNVTDVIAGTQASTQPGSVCAFILLDSYQPDGKPKTYQILHPPKFGAADFAKQDVVVRGIRIENKDVHTIGAFNNMVSLANSHFEGFHPKQKMLIFWGHGGGLQMLDEGQNEAKINIVEIGVVLKEWAKAEGEPLRFDTIAFDACYMCMIETMHHLRGVTDIALCSSTTVDSAGFPYDGMFQYFGSDTANATTQQVAAKCADLYNARYEDEEDHSLFICDMSKVDACIRKQNSVGKLLLDAFTSAGDRKLFHQQVGLALSSSHVFHGYANVLYLLRMLSTYLADANLAPARMDAINTELADFAAAVRACFKGKMGDDTDNPVSPQIWAPTSRSIFDKHSKIYNKLDASLGGYGGWVSFWRKYYEFADNA